MKLEYHFIWIVHEYIFLLLSAFVSKFKRLKLNWNICFVFTTDFKFVVKIML